MCAVACKIRRQVLLTQCPHGCLDVGDVGASGRLMDLPLELSYQLYAVRAATGCDCACCQAHEKVMASEESALHDGDVDRMILARALAASGHPTCRLECALERCQTCTGACGLSTAVWTGQPYTWTDGCCGQEEVKRVLRELIDTTVAAA